jgi:hypothetical protein
MIGEILSAGDFLLKLYSTRSKVDERTIAYVDCIAEDAEELARIWTGVLVNLLQAKSLSGDDEAAILRFQGLSVEGMFSNIAPFSRLDAFYDSLHSVLGPSNQKRADLLLEKLGTLMTTRNLTREEVSSVLGIGSWTTEAIEEAVLQINRQAAEIRIFAEELRARPRG